MWDPWIESSQENAKIPIRLGPTICKNGSGGYDDNSSAINVFTTDMETCENCDTTDDNDSSQSASTSTSGVVDDVVDDAFVVSNVDEVDDVDENVAVEANVLEDVDELQSSNNLFVIVLSISVFIAIGSFIVVKIYVNKRQEKVGAYSKVTDEGFAGI